MGRENVLSCVENTLSMEASNHQLVCLPPGLVSSSFSAATTTTITATAK